jgi:hypothetical protein
MNHIARIAVLASALFLIAAARALPLPPSQLFLPEVADPNRDVIRDPFGTLDRSAMTISASPVAGALSSYFSTQAIVLGGGGITLGPPRTSAFDVAVPRSGGVYFSLVTPAPRSNVIIGTVYVPDGGSTVILFGGSLVGLFLLRRFRVQIERWAMTKTGHARN